MRRSLAAGTVEHCTIELHGQLDNASIIPLAVLQHHV